MPTLTPIRVLVVALCSPSLRGHHGGARSIAWSVGLLAEEFDLRVLHLAPEAPADRSPGGLTGDPELIPLETPPAGVLRQGLRLGLALARGEPGYVAGTRSESMRVTLRGLVAGWSPDVIHFEHTASAQYARPYIARPRRQRPALVLVDHDAREGATRSDATWASRRSLRNVLEARAWRRWERLAPFLVDAVVTYTEADREAVLRRRPEGIVEVIAPHPPVAPREHSRGRADPNLILFVGNYAHAPNVDAARRLTRDILPGVRRRVPQARVAIVGPGDPGVRPDSTTGVDVLGYLDDLSDLRDRAAVEVVPVRLGGGIRVKLIEALTAGKAVVASPRAVEGIEVVAGRDLEVAADDREFADAIVRLLLNGGRRRGFEEAALAWAGSHCRPDREHALAYGRLYERLGVRAGERPS